MSVRRAVVPLLVGAAAEGLQELEYKNPTWTGWKSPKNWLVYAGGGAALAHELGLFKMPAIVDEVGPGLLTLLGLKGTRQVLDMMRPTTVPPTPAPPAFASRMSMSSVGSPNPGSRYPATPLQPSFKGTMLY